MDASLLSALSALSGAIIGGLTLLLTSFFAQRSQARVLGSTVIGGRLAASGIAIFFIPVTFYVVERLSSRAGTSPSSAIARTTGRSGRGGYPMKNSVMLNTSFSQTPGSKPRHAS